ncbi:hypothetical protein OHT68_48060 [Streptomyces canus]|uniref:hypothetical protein n=1 Tax=Streptomyces canus TaxID=58343 RepID=UPI002E2E21AE|nr:hypothetical protein [Streptomyces canus]
MPRTESGSSTTAAPCTCPEIVIARADTCRFTTEPWDVTAYRAGITSTQVWLRILTSEHGDHLIDVAPFWAQRPAAITFTAGGHTAAFPAIACPTAPADRRP